jgi:protein-disulfide isomerase
MKKLIGVSTCALALLLAGCGKKEESNLATTNMASAPPLTQVEAPNGDWTQIVSETPEGGFQMGNPNAPVKLVEYASVTCLHCAEFAEKGGEKLKNEYVKSGQVSWEFRPYLLFPTDAGISLLLRCQGATPFFRLMEQLYAEQKNWVVKFQNLSQAEAQRIQSLPPAQQVKELFRAGDMGQFFRQRGVPEARINACLNDQAGLEKLVGITQKANMDMPNFPGTPTFVINGEMVANVASWELLEPKLREAIG